MTRRRLTVQSALGPVVTVAKCPLLGCATAIALLPTRPDRASADCAQSGSGPTSYLCCGALPDKIGSSTPLVGVLSFAPFVNNGADGSDSNTKGGGFANFDADRSVFSGATADGDQDIWLRSGQLRAEHAFDVSNWYPKPRANLGIDYISSDSLTESGAGADRPEIVLSFDAAVNDRRSVSSVKVVLGVLHEHGIHVAKLSGRLFIKPGCSNCVAPGTCQEHLRLFLQEPERRLEDLGVRRFHLVTCRNVHRTLFGSRC